MADGNQQLVARLPEWGRASLGSRQVTMNYLLPPYPATRSGEQASAILGLRHHCEAFDSLIPEVGWDCASDDDEGGVNETIKNWWAVVTLVESLSKRTADNEMEWEAHLEKMLRPCSSRRPDTPLRGATSNSQSHMARKLPVLVSSSRDQKAKPKGP